MNDCKTIDQLCARDIGRRVRYADSRGEVVEGSLGYIMQRARKRFAIFNRHDMFEIKVGSYSIAGLSGRKEIEFL